MIIAGPGSGKTRTLTHRIAAAIASQQVRPEQCLALTFTRRAAEEMRQRLATLLGRRAARLTVTTFHGLGLMLLREQPELAGLRPDFAVADEQAVLDVATELAGSPRAAQSWLAATAGDAEQRDRLRQALAGRGLVDFDGLVELSAAAAPSSAAVAAGLRERWPRISVDEYQDIDAAQYELLRLLTGDGAGLTVIGDPDQAIYGFRGADVGFFLRFAADYPVASTVALSTQLPVQPGIVAGAHAGHRAGHAGAGPGTAAWPPAAQPPDAGHRHQLPTRRPTTAGRGGLDRRRASTGCSAAPRSTRWTAGGPTGTAPVGIGLADIAVLYRTDAQAAALGQGLTRAGLPFQKRSHDLLERRPGVAGIVREVRLPPGARAERARSVACRGGPAGRDRGRRRGSAVTASQAARCAEHRPAGGR